MFYIVYHIVYYTIFFISFQADKSNKLNNSNKSNNRQYRDIDVKNIAVKIFLKLAYRHSGIKKGSPENR